MIKKLKSFKPNKQELLLGLLTAVLFSSFLYLEHYFSLHIKLLNTITAILSLALFLYIPKKSVLIAGFVIGLSWFYWVSFSFIYYDFLYMMPFVILFFALGHMLLFGIIALTNKVYIRALLIPLIGYVEPMGWNWLQVELLFIDSYIGIFKYQLLIVLASLTLVHYVKKPYKYLPLILIVLAFNYNPKVQKETDLKIKLVQTDIKQSEKWKRSNLLKTVDMATMQILVAADKNYDIIVFPESFFPLYMNKSPKLIERLLDYSHDITIVAGSLLSEDGLHYNVTYMFKDGEYEIAKKMILVPFGEYIPLPKFARRFINDLFFNGASDFKTADKPSDFIIKGVKFRNAICYEASSAELYDDNVDFIIASSNNAWFTPSIEPTIQKYLIKLYARRYGVTVYHSTNSDGAGIIK